MMLNKLLLASAVTTIASAALFASASYAQTQGPHDGHNHSPQAQNQVQNLPAPDFVFTEAPDDHTIGGDFAPITIITYASVTCSHCGSWFTTQWPKIKADLVETNKIRFVLREFPTAPAPLSMTGFAMANCAPAEDFMSVIEYQMENQAHIFEQAQKGKAQKAFEKIAKIAGLDNNDEITACLSDPSNTEHIRLSTRRAEAAGIKGVPAFFINGEPYKGQQSAEAITQLVNGMLAAGSSSLPNLGQNGSQNPNAITINPAISPIQ